MKNYLLLNLYDNLICKKVLQEMSSYRDIHLNFPSNILQSHNWYENLFKQIKEAITSKQNIYIYSFNESCAKIAQKYRFNIHYCFINENINNKDGLFNLMLKDKTAEIFWLLDDNILNYDINECSSWLNNIKRPICPNINGNLIEDLNITEYENIRCFVSKIHNYFNNPLYTKEVDLPISSWIYNDCIIQKNNQFERLNIIMGISGDYLVKEDNIDFINFKGLLRNKQCNNCSFFESCKERGIGYIINKLNYKGCNSYKLIEYGQE